ncbi:jg23185 [Pararge aegeria aegeria]|uniref:Jg23185 protein n=1 Tax=Pararge aegeria aegeria TaxID=348720 RepID=A0A8S4QTJ2_9NEOP|nr:jg23185 [Pararge aegeria aegeria]
MSRLSSSVDLVVIVSGWRGAGGLCGGGGGGGGGGGRVEAFDLELSAEQRPEQAQKRLVAHRRVLKQAPRN